MMGVIGGRGEESENIVFMICENYIQFKLQCYDVLLEQSHIHSFTHCLWLLVFAPVAELRKGRAEKVVGSFHQQSLKYSLPGLLQKKLANPCFA